MSLQAWSASEWRSIVAEVLSLTSDPAATSAQLDDAHQNLFTAGMPQTRPENLSQAELQEIVALRQTALEALAAHPNLSAPTLAKLVRETPEGFCRNPVASLFFVEYPALLAEFDIPTLRRVLRCAEAPMALLLSLVESDRLPEIAAEAALHVSVRGEIPAERWREEVIAYLCSIAKAASGAQTEPPQTFCRIAARMHPGIDRGELLRGWRSIYWTERLATALNTAADRPTVLPALCEDGNALVRAAAQGQRRGEYISPEDIIAGIDTFHGQT